MKQRCESISITQIIKVHKLSQVSSWGEKGWVVACCDTCYDRRCLLRNTWTRNTEYDDCQQLYTTQNKYKAKRIAIPERETQNMMIACHYTQQKTSTITVVALHTWETQIYNRNEIFRKKGTWNFSEKLRNASERKIRKNVCIRSSASQLRPSLPIPFPYDRRCRIDNQKCPIIKRNLSCRWEAWLRLDTAVPLSSQSVGPITRVSFPPSLPV